MGNHSLPLREPVQGHCETRARQAGIQSVEIGMCVLDALAEATGPMSLKEICTATGAAPSKVHRYLVSFVRTGMLKQFGVSGRYDFGPTARRLGMVALGRLDAVAAASDEVIKLRDETGHTICLTVWGDEGPVVVRWEIGVYPMYMSIRVGSTVPLESTAIGRTYLAHLPKTVTEPVVKRQRKLASAGSAQARVSARVLKDIRASVSLHAESALIAGIDAIAAPVFNAQGGVSSVVCLLGPHKLFAGRATNKLKRAVEEAVNRISIELGHREDQARV